MPKTTQGVSQEIHRPQTHWGKKAAPWPLLEAREPPTGLHGDQKELEPGRWGLVSCVSNKSNNSITSFMLFLLFINLGRSCLRFICTHSTGGHQLHADRSPGITSVLLSSQLSLSLSLCCSHTRSLGLGFGLGFGLQSLRPLAMQAPARFPSLA